jgi:ABC-2 type transport system ATP-binding protein
MPSAITIQGLSKTFGKHAILSDLSLEVGQGEVYGLVGLNGAGKTTLIRLMLGILKSSAGALTVLGSDPWAHDARLHRRMGVVLEHDGFWGNLTFEQNLKFFAAAKNIAWSDAQAYVKEFWRHTDICMGKKPVKFFSRGQRMQCALCRAFLGWPELYLFDEPAVALDLDAYDHFTKLAKHARDGGATLVVSSHQLETIEELSDRVGILRDKKVTELTTMGKRGIEPLWELDADEAEEWAAIILATCGSSSTYENGRYRFVTPSPPETVPLLVKRLVDAGCSIRQIGPAETAFGDLIRSEYRKQAVGDTPAKGDRCA